MNDSPLMVGVSGLRGIVGGSLTPDVATRFAAAFGSHLLERLGVQVKGGKAPTRRPMVVVARDGRLGGEVVQSAAINGLVSVGCDVVIADAHERHDAACSGGPCAPAARLYAPAVARFHAWVCSCLYFFHSSIRPESMRQQCSPRACWPPAHERPGGDV